MKKSQAYFSKEKIALFLLILTSFLFIGNSITTLFNVQTNSGKVCYNDYGCPSNLICCKPYNYEEGFCSAQTTCELIKTREDSITGFSIANNLYYGGENKKYWSYEKELAIYELILGFFGIGLLALIYKKRK